MRTYALSLAILSACDKPQSEQHADHKTPEDSTSQTIWTAPETVPPTFEASALGEGLNQAISLAQTLDPSPVYELYDELMRYEDGYCPYSYGYATTYGGDVDSWYAQCDAESGATYSGYAYYYLYDDSYSRYEGLYLSASVLSPSGVLFSAQGDFEFGVSSYGNTIYSYANIDGIVDYDSDDYPGSFFAEGLAPALYIERNYRMGGGWNYLYAEGQIAGLSAGGVDAVDFVDVSLDSSYDCPEPEGVISVRSVDGDWFEITFSGADGGCDGCGEARWLGISMGEVCGDFSPWMTGEVSR